MQGERWRHDVCNRWKNRIAPEISEADMGETGDADGLNREQAVEQDVSEIAQKVPREEITANGERLVQVDFEAYEFADLRIKVQFPDVYPEEACRLEVSSKTLPHELVHKLRSTAESRASTQASEKKRHVADVVEYLRNALKTNRLAPAYEEVRSITAALPKECIQMQQKAGDIRVSLESRGYFLSFKLNVPSDYPMSKPKFEILKHNFPKELIANFEGQANEIAKKYEEGNLTVDETRMQQQARPSGTSANLGPSAAAGSPSSPSTGDRISVPLGPATRDDSSQKANQVQVCCLNQLFDAMLFRLLSFLSLSAYIVGGEGASSAPIAASGHRKTTEV